MFSRSCFFLVRPKSWKFELQIRAASYLRRVLCKTRLIFPSINDPYKFFILYCFYCILWKISGWIISPADICILQHILTSRNLSHGFLGGSWKVCTLPKTRHIKVIYHISIKTWCVDINGFFVVLRKASRRVTQSQCNPTLRWYCGTNDLGCCRLISNESFPKIL